MPPENEHQSQRSTPSDIAGIDWLIMSGVSSPEHHPELPTADPDLDDEAFLQSIGLDDPVPDTSGNLHSDSPSQIGGIDWLIVTDVNERVRTSGLDTSSIPKTAPHLKLIRSLPLRRSVPWMTWI
ncbi:MAG: hypothetical protein HC919_08435 [Oscillatoriales cyanobacterium SM2_2_1]|nr:hypothetical protein [Oscillatoriales cyanobacterium SM2_2_1]